ncbi:MAG: hypothetical protein JJU33_01880 [Phycisphaerales bacterium]|nr:hypothetical protein [Phycisphaerales bacterium]
MKPLLCFSLLFVLPFPALAQHADDETPRLQQEAAEEEPEDIDPALLPRAEGPPPEHELTPGVRWAAPLSPITDARLMTGTTNLVLPHGFATLRVTPQQSLQAEVFHAGEPGPARIDIPHYEVVLYDIEGERIPQHRPVPVASSAAMHLTVNFAGADLPDRVAWFGVTLLDADGRKERAAAARETLAETGSEAILPPLPIAGQVWLFDLPLTTGRARATTDRMLGKPAIVYAWCSSSPACLVQMSRLDRLRREVGDSVSFLGINLDADRAQMQRSLRRARIEWPQVHAYSITSPRDWLEVSLIQPPHLVFVLDAEGRLVGQVESAADARMLLQPILEGAEDEVLTDDDRR